MTSPMSNRSFITFSTDQSSWPSKLTTQLNNGDRLLVVDVSNGNALTVYLYDEEAEQWRGI